MGSKHIVLLIFAISAALCSALAAQNVGTATALGHTDAIIDGLVSTPDFGITYIANGAGDGTVLNDKPSTAAKNVVKLQGAALPFLIHHLDDMRLTSARYKGGAYWNDPIAVPVGYVCLDILRVRIAVGFRRPGVSIIRRTSDCPAIIG